jgi:hypothetical protein
MNVYGQGIGTTWTSSYLPESASNLRIWPVALFAIIKNEIMLKVTDI